MNRYNNAFASLLALFLSLPVCIRAQTLIADDAVFAHDFGSITDNTIRAFRGPDATKTSNLFVNSESPIGIGSPLHIRAPIGLSFATINTNTRLSAPTSALSFSIFYNDRGDNGAEADGSNLVRLLSTYNGTGSVSSSELIFDLVSTARGRQLRFFTNNTEVYSTATLPFQDRLWHHAGCVFDNGTVTFYFDGVRFGEQQLLGRNTIAAQTFNWFLIEDAREISTTNEYFDGGDYDEAALWYRALSAQEMNRLYHEGLGALPITVATIRGRITLQGAVNQGQPVIFEFRPIDGAAVFQRTVTLNPDSTFSIPDVPRNTYSVWVKGQKWLAKTRMVNITFGDANGVNLTLPAGDANGDNFADALDLAELITAFNSEAGDGLYNAVTDFNTDDVCDADDLSLLIENFNTEGEP